MAQDNSSSILAQTDSNYLKQEYASRLNELVAKLEEKYDVKSFLFGEKINEGTLPDYKDKTTDFEQLLNELQNRYVNRNLGAVVIATDAGFTSVVYNNTNVSGGLTSFTIPAGSLLGNTNYFVRVTPRNSVNVTPSVTCNAVSFRTEVANNNAAGAIALTFASSCSTTAATSTGASASSVTNGVGVSGANDDDVWFSFVPTTQNVTISVTGGTTLGTLQNPVIELALSNGTTFATFDGNTGATEIGSANVPFVDGRNYLVRVYSRSTNVTNAGTFNICVIGAATLTGNNTISGDYGSVTVTTGNTLTINGATTVGNLTVESGGTLIVQGSNVVSGNIFTLAAGATLQIASPAGISSGTSA